MNSLYKGTLPSNGQEFEIRPMTLKDVNKALALQLRIIRDLERNKHNDYIHYKSREDLEAIYCTNSPEYKFGKRAIGAFSNGKLIAHTVISKVSPKDMPDINYPIKENSAEIGGVWTDIDYRGNKLMQHMLDVAQVIAKDEINCTSACAVIDPNNIASWKTFVDKNFKIIDLGKDPFDGSSVFYAYKNISNNPQNSFFINKNNQISISNNPSSRDEIKDAFKKQYIITSYDKETNMFNFAKSKFGKDKETSNNLDEANLLIIKSKLSHSSKK